MLKILSLLLAVGHRCTSCLKPPDILYLQFTFNRIKSKGLTFILMKLMEKVSMLSVGFVLIPLTLAFHFCKFRVVNIFTERIGHLAIEPLCVSKDYKNKYKLIIIKSGTIANHYLSDLWRSDYIIIESVFLSWILKSMTMFRLASLNCSKYERVFNQPRLSFKIFANNLKLESLINIPLGDYRYLYNFLEKLGFKSNDWFVCIHAREAGFSPVDDQIQMHRNADINSYDRAIRYILRMGGWVIRLGDSSMKKILSCDEKVIDYAHSELKSEMLDVLLCKHAKFILGSSSGICTLGSLLGTPCAISNIMPVADAWFTRFDIYTTKKIFVIKEQRVLTLFEMMTLPVCNFRFASEYDEAGYTYFENSSEEIYNLCAEMFDFINRRFIRSRKQLDVNSVISSFRTARSNAYYSESNFSTSFFDQLQLVVFKYEVQHGITIDEKPLQAF